MNKDFLPYPWALRMKALGFDEPCILSFDHRMNLSLISEIKNWNEPNGDTMSLPTFSQCFRWFREKYGLSGVVVETLAGGVRYGGIFIKSEKGSSYIQYPQLTSVYDTYEEAELACLDKLIEIVEQKNNKYGR